MSDVVSSFVASLAVQQDKGSFQSAEAALTGIGATASKVAGTLGVLFASGAAVNYFKDLIASGDALNDLIAKTGIGGQQLQALGLAAEQNGSSLEELGAALSKLQINGQAAAGGSKDAAAAFRSFGVSAEDLKNGLPTDEILGRLADKIADTSDPAKRAALAVKVLGKAGAALVPTLAQGRDGLAEIEAKFKALGGGLTDDFIQKSDEVNDQLAELHVATTSLGVGLGSVLLPAVIKTVHMLTDWAVAIQKLLEGSEFVRSALIVGAAAFIAWGVASLFASQALRSKAGLLFLLTLLAAALDEVSVAARGGKTLIGQWIDKWTGLGTVDSLVRSIGEGLKEINRLGFFGGIKQAVADVGELYSDAAKRQKRVDELKKQLAAERDPEKRFAIAAQLKKQLEYNRDVATAQMGETPRTQGQGIGSAVEEVQAGEATASAVNEGMAATLFGETRKAGTNAQGKTIMLSPTTVNKTVNQQIRVRTGANPQQIAREAKRSAVEALDETAESIKRTQGRTDPLAGEDEMGGDDALEGLDE
jgi:hypothetical protein